MSIIPDNETAHDDVLTEDDLQAMDLFALAVLTGTYREAGR
ncbi:hypothetical protein [Luteimicrobium sp. DT211]